MKSLRLLFLDVDGVLNDRDILVSASDKSKARGQYNHRDHMADMIGAKYIERVNTLTDRAKADIVMSSTWRCLFDSMPELREFFTSVGLKGKILGRTPRGFPGQKFSENSLRGLEIQAFLSAMTAQRDVESLVILDDNTDMAHLKHRLVKTDGVKVALTDEDVEKAVKLFDTKDDAHLTFKWDDWNTYYKRQQNR
jgi:hypothetical protein